MRAAWWWIDRWRKSTAYTDMTAEEQGVYRNLLDELWLRDGLLPLSPKALSQISGDHAAWDRVGESVLARFRRTPEGYRHPTHDEVAAQSKSYREAQSEAGRSRVANAARGPDGRLQPGGPAGKSSQYQPVVQPANQPPYSELRTPSSETVTDSKKKHTSAVVAGPRPAATWPDDLLDVRTELERLELLTLMDDPVYWRGVDDWLGPDDSGVSYLIELRKYSVWRSSQNGRKKHSDPKRGFRNWLSTAERMAERESQRAAIYKANGNGRG